VPGCPPEGSLRQGFQANIRLLLRCQLPSDSTAVFAFLTLAFALALALAILFDVTIACVAGAVLLISSIAIGKGQRCRRRRYTLGWMALDCYMFFYCCSVFVMLSLCFEGGM
jgi:hypothetical protein